MNWLTFISNLVGALAWPSVVLIVAFALRRQLTLLLPHVKHLRYGDFEVEFGRRIEYLKHEVEQANLPPPAAADVTPPAEVPPLPRTTNYLIELADVFPRAAVLEAWREVELAAKEAAARAGMGVHADRPLRYLTMQALLDTLRKDARIDKSIPSILNDLRGLRNSVAHTRQADISPAKAKDYVRLALRVISALRGPENGEAPSG